MVTDGSNLYPGVLGGLWADADHQLCVFYVIKDINKLILDAVRRMRSVMSRPGREEKVTARRGMTLKEKAGFAFKRRHLIVKRREDLTKLERADLIRIQGYLPQLATLRRFVDRICGLFDTPKDLHQAGCRRATIVRDAGYQAVPELAKAMEQIGVEKFAKWMAYWKNPLSRRVRTNNHVERTNRMFRFLEKVRYKWRHRKTLVRFVVLKLDVIGSDRTAAQETEADRSRSKPPGRTEGVRGKRSQAA